MQVRTSFGKRYGWLLLALLTAVSLRLYHLTSVPPGLTHDEADHGITAWSIVDEGVRDIYFTIGYGREPLYDYLTAGLMALLGPTYLAGRLVSVFASLLALAALYAWVALAFDRRVALLTLAGTAVAFWPLMTARQMLRSSLLPLLLTLAVLLFWRGLKKMEIRNWQLEIAHQFPIPNPQSPIPNPQSLIPNRHFFLAGISLGLAFYVYLPARVLWALFPLLLLFGAVADRPLLRRVWRETLMMLGTAVLVAAPLFLYLARNPQLEARVAELSAPLQAAAQGNLQPLLQNSLASLRLFTLSGDTAWRYNIPARPFLDPLWGGPLWGALFYAGILLALYAIFDKQGSKGAGGQRSTPAPPLPRSSAFIALTWLLLGMAPVLVTGPELATTQAIGAQPVLFLFPALALARLRDWGLGIGKKSLIAQRQWLIALLLFGGTAVYSARAYFHTWANAPEVRVQYETTMVTALQYLAQHPVDGVAISTIAPAPEHSPAVARLILPHAEAIRWFDGRSSLLLPANTQTTVLIPGFAPLPEGLLRYWTTAVRSDTLPMRPTDLDRPVAIYQIETGTALAQWRSQFTPPPAPTYLGDALQFLGYDLQTPAPRPGETLRLATLWQVRRLLPQAQLFTHLWPGSGKPAPPGEPAAQRDLLGAPAANWRTGDLLIQLHEFVVPETAVATTYQLLTGGYDPVSGARYPVTQAGQPAGDAILLQPITLEP